MELELHNDSKTLGKQLKLLQLFLPPDDDVYEDDFIPYEDELEIPHTEQL
jgi:hypothetical protein